MTVDIVNNVKSKLRACSNIHLQGNKKNIILMATPRGGSTWVMEMIASQPGMKYYDEPFNVLRYDVIETGRIKSRQEVMPDTCDENKICNYLLDISHNKMGGMNPPPFRKNHRLITNRIVFKIHELEHLLEKLRITLDAQVLCLYRHPIPTTLSRAMLPRLDFYMTSRYYRDHFLDAITWSEIEKIHQNGNHLEKGVLSWCFENMELLHSKNKQNWLMLSYEELLLNSRKCCHYLADKLQLNDLDALLKSVGKPSVNITMSGKETHHIMQDRDDTKKNQRLVTKWRSKVDTETEERIMSILKMFDIDMYVNGRAIPQPAYLLFDDTCDPDSQQEKL